VPETGELVLTDTANASRIAASTSNFAADHAKLRKLMAESFLISAAYRCSQLMEMNQTLSIFQTCFELSSKTGRETMKNRLDVVEALGLVTKPEKDQMLGTLENFGNTTFYAETQYDDELATKLFLNSDGSARSEDEYENAGRQALRDVVQEGERDDYRRLPATDDELWQELREASNPELFKSINKIKKLKNAKKIPIEIVVGGIKSDFLLIRWWAKEMRGMAEKLAEVKSFLKNNPSVSGDNSEFKALRKNLAGHLKGVASRTKTQFGDPWGLIAIDLVTNQKAKSKTQITGPIVSLLRERTS